MAEETKKPMVFDENTIWTTLDGRKIKVKDLDTRHAINIIKHLEKKGFVSSRKYRYDAESMIITSIFCGDEAGLLDDDDNARIYGYSSTLEKHPSRMIDAILDELEKRGVTLSA